MTGKDDDLPDVSKMSKREFRKYVDGHLANDAAKHTQGQINRMWEEARDEAVRNQEDEDLKEIDRIMQRELGFSLDDLREQQRRNEGSDEWRKDLQGIMDAVQKGNKDQARKRARRGKKNKPAKKGIFDCAVIAVMILAGLSALAYGAYEGASALASLIW